MDNESARIILSAYRSTGADASDPVFADALEQARRDPALAEWFAGQRAVDERMCAALQSVIPPAGLKSRILASGRVIEFSGRRSWWSRPAWLALAASILILLGVTAVFFQKETARHIPLAVLTDEIFQIQKNMPSLGAMSSDTAELRRWLADRGTPHDFAIPSGLHDKMGIGCQVYSIRGSKVSLICFQLENKQMAHYFVTDRRNLTDSPAIGQTIYLQKDGVTFATWSDDRRTYVLASTVPADELKRLL